MTRERVVRLIRDIRPGLIAASLVCFALAGLIGFQIIDLDRTIAAEIQVSLGWAGWGAFCFGLAYATGEPR